MYIGYFLRDAELFQGCAIAEAISVQGRDISSDGNIGQRLAIIERIAWQFGDTGSYSDTL